MEFSKEFSHKITDSTGDHHINSQPISNKISVEKEKKKKKKKISRKFPFFIFLCVPDIGKETRLPVVCNGMNKVSKCEGDEIIADDERHRSA
jgi:hypothetical protein